MSSLDASKKLSMGAMATALTVLSLYAAGVLPTGRIALYFISSLFIYTLVCEEAYFSAGISFIASAVIAAFILPDKLALVPYAFLLGHYGIARSLIGKHIHDRFIAFIVKLLYCDAFLALAAYVAKAVFQYDFSAIQPPFSIWLLIPILQTAFIAYELLYAMCCRIYEVRLRKHILPRR